VAVLSHTLAVRTSSTLTDSARDHRGDSMAKVGEIWDDGTLIMVSVTGRNRSLTSLSGAVLSKLT
jgi:hypothetical protein